MGEHGKRCEVGRSDTPAETEKKISRDPDLFLVAETNGCIIGSVIGGFDSRRGLIYHLAVATAFCEQGIGSCLKCYLMVAPDNTEVEGYYQQRGWHSMDHVHLFGKDLQ